MITGQPFLTEMYYIYINLYQRPDFKIYKNLFFRFLFEILMLFLIYMSDYLYKKRRKHIMNNYHLGIEILAYLIPKGSPCNVNKTLVV